MDREQGNLRNPNEGEPLDRPITDYAEYDDQTRSSEIKAEIDRTRRNMDETIDALSEKLHPRHLLDDVIGIFKTEGSCAVPSGKDTARQVGHAISTVGNEVAHGVSVLGRVVGRQVYNNPVPALLIGAGIAWMLYNDQDDRPRRRRRGKPFKQGRNRDYGGSVVDARTGLPYDESYGRDWSSSTSHGSREGHLKRQEIQDFRSMSGYSSNEQRGHILTASGTPYLHQSTGTGHTDVTSTPYSSFGSPAITSPTSSSTQTPASSQAGSSWKEKATELGQGAKETMKETTENIKNTASNVTGNMTSGSRGNEGCDMSGGITGGMNEGMHSAHQKTGGVMQSSAEYAKSGYQSAAHYAEEGYEHARHYFQEGYEAALSAAQQAARGARSTGHTASQLAQEAWESAEGVGYYLARQGRNVSRQARSGYRYTRNQLSEAIEDYPVGVGVTCLALGVIAGFLLPHTRQEDRSMGRLSHRVRKDALRSGENILNRGQQVASATLHAAIEEMKKQGLTPEEIKERLSHIVNETTQAAQEAIHREGFDPESLKQKASSVAEQTKDTAKQEAERNKEEIKSEAQRESKTLKQEARSEFRT